MWVHLLKNICYCHFPLLVLKAIYHYWTYVYFSKWKCGSGCQVAFITANLGWCSSPSLRRSKETALGLWLWPPLQGEMISIPSILLKAAVCVCALCFLLRVFCLRLSQIQMKSKSNPFWGFTHFTSSDFRLQRLTTGHPLLSLACC